MKKLIIMGLCLCLGAPMIANAQERKVKITRDGHYVKTKIKAPKYRRAASPGDGYVYIKDDYTWNEGTRRWEWNGNRWVTPAQTGQTWVAGRWRRSPGGWTWVEGHWR